MIIQYSPYIILLFLGALVCTGIGRYCFLNRQVPGNGAFSLLMAALTIWLLGSILEYSAVDVFTKYVATILEYPGIVLVPVGWFLFAQSYSGRNLLIGPKNYWLLGVIPFLVIIFVITNPFHHLYYSSIDTTIVDSLVYTVYHFGPLYWVNVVYSYSLILLGIGIILTNLFHSSRLYRKQILIVLIVSVIPFLINALHVSGIGPVQGLDLTPFAFLFSGICIFISVSRFQFLSLAPIVHRLVINNIRDGLIVTDNNNLILDLNPSALQYCQNPESGYLGRGIGDVFPVTSDLMNADNTDVTVMELPVKGELRYCETWCRPVINEQGVQIGKLITIHDAHERITATKALDLANQKLKVTQEELEKFTSFLEWRVVQQTSDIRALSDEVLERNREVRHLLRQKDLFINQLAHDLRTPITPMVALVPLLKEKISDPELRDYVEIFEKKLKSLQLMIEDVILYAHLNNQVYIYDYAEYSLRDLVQVILVDKKNLADIHDVRLINDIPDTIRITLSRIQAPIIFRNLISNAIKYNIPGGEVRITATVHKNWVTIPITDTGIGISAEDLKTIWDEFSTGDPARTDPLSKGLGLSIARRIASMHNGYIVASSLGPGFGSTFTLTLPLHPVLGEENP